MEIIKIALNSLRINKLRSALTIVGIIVGIFSIISISTVVEMLQKSIEEGVSSLGQNTFQIQKFPAMQTGGPAERMKYRNRKDITYDEFEKLKERLVEAKGVGAEQWQNGKVIKFYGKETNPNVSVAGITPEGFINNNWIVAEGRDFNQQDMKSCAANVVLGADIARVLFAGRITPIGQTIRIGQFPVKIIGVLESKGSSFGQSQDNFAIIPLTTFQQFYGKHARSLNITVMSFGKQDYDDLIEKATGYFRQIRKVPLGQDNDFDIFSNESILGQINDMTRLVRIGVIAVAGIALLAAGVGIMNIMLVSVTERTREIGIRKAIGAKKRNILVQFLFEAVVLCLIGGFIGIISGVLLGNIAGSLLNAVPVIPIDWVIVGFMLCVIIGVVFGTYPAIKASNLDPIEALRYE